MKPSIRLITPLLGSIALLGPARAADVLRSNNNATLLNNTASWQGGVLPTAADVIVFDSTGVPAAATAASVVAGNAMGAALSVLGIRVANNVGGTINTTNYLAIHNNGAASPFTLSIGASGVDMSAANQALRIQAAIALTADQTWTVGNGNTAANVMGFNNGEDLSFDATSAGQAFNLGGFTVNVNGAGAVNITSGFTISNGIFNINNTAAANTPGFVIQGGGSRVATVNADVTFNLAPAAVLHFQSNSGAGGASFLSNGTINLNGGILRLAQNNATLTLTVNGIINVNSASTLNIGKPLTNTGAAGPIIINGNLAGSGALSFVNDVGNAPTVSIGGDNSGYTGAITFGGTAGRVTRFTASTAGSAAATWNINAGHTLALNAVNLDFGTLNGAGTVNTSAAGTSVASVGAGTFTGILADGTGTLGLTKVGAGTLTLSGANTFTGDTAVNGGKLATTTARVGGTNVTTAAGTTFGVTLASAGTSFNAPTLTTGASSTLELNVVTFGNTTVPVFTTTTFAPAATTTISLLGSGFTTGVDFPLISYTGVIGGGGFGALSLALPFRVVGSLVDNAGASRVDANISATSIPAWRGNVNSNWDIDSVGNGSTGSANWFATSGPNTYVQGAPVGTDRVQFDDTATGSTTVNLTTTLTPISTTVNNSALTYTFGGTGKLSGTTALAKTGTGTLIIANTTANDYTGGTTIDGGTIRIGDGATVGAGTLGGTITINAGGTLDLNRPSDFTFSNVLAGTGALRKSGANTATRDVATTFGGAVDLAGGKMLFAAGGNLSGPISGAGQLEKNGATLTLSGADPNTNTGLTTVTAGRLDLSKTAGVNAVGGNILITGTGQLGIMVAEQIPDTATITFTGSSTDSIPTQAGIETVAGLIVDSSVGGALGGQVIMRSGFTVNGTATLNNGILGVASGNTGAANAVNITSAPGSTAILRIAGSGGPSFLNVGAGGITASGGEIQVKFNANAQDATLNLGGNFTATGDVAITNAGYTGPNLNVINLTADRTFDIASGTTTSVAPDIAGPGGLTKVGAGTLALGALSAGTYSGATLVNAGTLQVDGSLSGSGVTVAAAALLKGAGVVNAPLFVNGTLSPGASPGIFTLGATNLTFGSAAVSEFELASTSSFDRVVGIDALTLDGTVNVSLFGGYNPVFGDSFDLFDSASINASGFSVGSDLILPALNPGLSWDSGSFTTNGVIAVVPEPGSAMLLIGGLALLAGRRRKA